MLSRNRVNHTRREIKQALLLYKDGTLYSIINKLKKENYDPGNDDMAAILVAVILINIYSVFFHATANVKVTNNVVYGKTGGDKKSAKLYHGGARLCMAYCTRIYQFLSMKPMQIDCKLTGALSAQNIRVDVPTTITVAISTDPEVMQNAAERMLGLTMDDKQNLITDVVYGQMRLVIADMTIEELNSDRDKFLSKVKDNIDTELRKFGLYLMNINISDIRDAANYIVNLGKEAESKAQNEAQANIEEQEKLGAIKIANQIKRTRNQSRPKPVKTKTLPLRKPRSCKKSL